MLSHLPRRNLTQEQIATTADLDSHLPQALDAIRRLLPSGWVEEESPELSRLDHLAKPESILSLTKGLRPESELPSIHRFRQAIRVSRLFVRACGLRPFCGCDPCPIAGPTWPQLTAEQWRRQKGRLQHMVCDSGNVI
jgi:hypothetical protein